MVHVRSDPAPAQLGANAVALAHPDDVVLIDVPLVAAARGRREAGVGKERVVAPGDREPARVPSVETAQLHAQHRGLHRVEPAVVADDQMLRLDLLPEIARDAHALGHVRVGGADRAAVAVGAEVLRRIEAERGDRAERPGAPAAMSRAVRLAPVFDEGEPASLGERGERVEIGDLAVQMDGHHRFGARRDGGLGQLGIDQMIVAHVDQNRSRAELGDREGARDEGVRRNDHLVAGSDTERLHPEPRALRSPRRRRRSVDAPRYAANSSSNAATSGPRMKLASSSTRESASRTSASIVRYCAFRSMNGIGSSSKETPPRHCGSVQGFMDQVKSLSSPVRPLRILTITRHIPARSVVPVDRGGGGDTAVEAVLRLPELSDDLRFDVVALAPDGPPIEAPRNVTIRCVRSQRLRDLLWVHREGRSRAWSAALLAATAALLVREARALLRTNAYDLVYAVGGPIAGLAGVAVKHLARRPLAIHFHHTYNVRAAGAPVRAAVRTFYRQADAFIGNCAMQVTDAAAIGVPRERCHAVTNWIDHETFRPLEPRGAHRARWHVEPGQTAFYFGGRFCPTKHVDRIAAALRGFDDPRAVFFFAGDGVLAAELHALAAANPNVRVLPTLPRTELPSLHAACDVQFWGSIDVDYPGLVVMEAMSSGLPVYTANETMNTFYPGAPVDPFFLDVPRLSRLFDATPQGIRAAVSEAIARREELRALRPDVAAFARERFGRANALQLIEIFRATSARGVTTPAPLTSAGSRYVTSGDSARSMSTASTPCMNVWSWFETSYFQPPKRPRLTMSSRRARRGCGAGRRRAR